MMHLVTNNDNNKSACYLVISRSDNGIRISKFKWVLLEYGLHYGLLAQRPITLVLMMI